MKTTTALLDLQAVDLGIDRLEHRRRTLEGGAAQLAARAAADEAEREVGELRLQLDVFDRDGVRFEHEIDSLAQKAEAEQRRMSDGSVANARELEAIGREVENLRRRMSDREDELLAMLEQREEVERRATAAAALAEERRAGADALAGESGEELARIEADLATQRAERALLAGGIDPELLALYEDLRSHKKGVGAAALVDGICQGCHERLSSVELDHAKHADGVPRCEHCRRILVL
ncbi:MAG TPA: C4-type zinc ribbon domain-containing protein [Actinomycetota bacterium]